VEAGTLVVRERLHRRGVALERFTVAWNLAEALVAIAAGVAAGSIALIGFGVDSGIEVIAASALLWRFSQAKADASEEEHGNVERRALLVVSSTFFALAAYIAFEAIQGLISEEQPETSTVGLILAIVSLAVMPTLAYAKQRTGRALASRALQADAIETWVCAYLCSRCSSVSACTALSAGGGRIPSPRSRCFS
jgi:divalent metal cation (Fe/Co/Zn/Cd) transporter